MDESRYIAFSRLTACHTPSLVILSAAKNPRISFLLLIVLPQFICFEDFAPI
jgi:hypothetical protein